MQHIVPVSIRLLTCTRCRGTIAFMVKLILFFYAVVAVITLGYLITVWVDPPVTTLPYREPIHRRW